MDLRLMNPRCQKRRASRTIPCLIALCRVLRFAINRSLVFRDILKVVPARMMCKNCSIDLLERSIMPKRTDIKSVLILGAGPIIIGQACEFDYSGTQACRALRAEGYRVVLVNSNPATIMTDPEMADATYIEPI